MSTSTKSMASEPAGAPTAASTRRSKRGFTLRALAVGGVFMLVFSYMVTVALNRQTMYMPATQISSLSFFFAFVLMLAVNPLLKLARLRPFARSEAFLIFIMATVPAGLPLFGYLGQTVTLVGALHHPQWNNPQTQWSEHVVPHLDPHLFVDDAGALEDYVRGLRARDREAYPVFVKKPTETWGEFGSRAVSWFGATGSGEPRPPFFGEAPWGVWMVPLAYWLALALVLIAFFYALNELIFRQWYRHEKLVFPLAEMATTILDVGDVDRGEAMLPRIYRNPLFWAGFAVAFGVIFYNGMVNARWIEGLSGIPLQQNRTAMASMFQGTILEGLNPTFRFHIFFTVIGLAFLLPAKISFSVWFFHLLMRAQQLVAVWMGYGINEQSFPSNWFTTTNFMTSQGGGAMTIFGLVYLWKVRHQMVSFIYRAIGKKKAGDLTQDDIRHYSGPSLLFFVASALIVLFLFRGGVSPGFVALIYLGVLLLTVAMVRVVCECGIIAMQPNFGPLHFLNVFGLLRFPAMFAKESMATAGVFLGTMFFDQKTFIAPTMMNARFMAAEGNIGRRNYVRTVFLAVLICLVVAMVVTVVLAYDQGVESMDQWFFGAYPRSTFNQIRTTITNIEALQQFDASNAGWYGLGAAVCGVLIYLRQFVFWLPHPIGLVLMVSPLMHAYWFSFFLAWLCKRAAVRYLTSDGYRRARELFIGLVIGEVTAIAISLLLAMYGYRNMGLTFNR